MSGVREDTPGGGEHALHDQRDTGGQTSGTALVSINISSFESYGPKRATNSPICAPCAERFNKALKGLMKSRRTHQRTGALVYAFWTVEEAQDIAKDLLNQPTPQDVRELILSPWDGKRRDVLEANFYALSLSANAARIVVRNWLTLTVRQVLSSLAQWYRWQNIVDAYGAEGAPVPYLEVGGVPLPPDHDRQDQHGGCREASQRSVVCFRATRVSPPYRPSTPRGHAKSSRKSGHL